jgi:Icc-related predicted phosphoesterase
MYTSRLLHISDLHANDAWYRWAERMRTRFGLVVISGDLLDLNAHRPVGDQVPRVKAHLGKLAASPLALVSGNHDRLPNAGPELVRSQWMQGLRASAVWTDGDAFACAGFTVRCIGWTDPVPDSAGENEVWIVHAPPDGAKTAIARGGVSFGDWDLARVCAENRGPRLLLGGHVHDPVEWCAKVGRTWSLNPGYAEGAEYPNYNIVDLSRGVAMHRRAAGTEDIRKLW